MMQRQVPTVHSFMLPVQFLDTVLDMPVLVLRQVPGVMVQKTVVRPQLQSIYGRRHSLSVSRGSSPWSRLFSRPQRFSSCCSISGGRCPCCVGRAYHAALMSTTTVCAQGWLCWLRCASAVFLLVVAGQDLRHLGWYDPKDSYCGMFNTGYAGSMHLALFSRPGLQAHDARHHGLFGPKGLWQWHV